MLKGKEIVLFQRMRIVLLIMGVVIGLVILLVLLPVKVNAALTGNVSPSVNVTAGGSLALTNTINVQWGDAAAGSTRNGTLNCTITTNTTVYNAKVLTNQVLTSGANTIPSVNFTYTSAYVSGSPATNITYQTTATQFSTVSPGTAVATAGSLATAAVDLNTGVTYTLNIPAGQAAATGYTATHTYTLTAG
jgi:hypothetical protein